MYCPVFAHKICSRSLYIKTTQRAHPTFDFSFVLPSFLPTIMSSHSRSVNGSLPLDRDPCWSMNIPHWCFWWRLFCSMLLAVWSYSVTPAWNRLSLYWDHSQLLGSRTCEELLHCLRRIKRCERNLLLYCRQCFYVAKSAHCSRVLQCSTGYNDFDYNEHPTKRADFFASIGMLISLVTRPSYNPQFVLHHFTHCKRDPVLREMSENYVLICQEIQWH